MGKKMTQFIVMVMFISMFILTACGEKSQESVTKNLEKTLNEMDGYKVKAEMKMNTGQEEQLYDVDVWFKKDDYFRVALENEHNKEGQVILKNQEGVFVLTPALKKSFKFQTDWPDNSSQPYLYQSLVKDVLLDSDAQFNQDESHYIYETKTNYQGNNHLPYQEIYFDKKTYLPSLVKVMDKEHEVLIEVTFSDLEMNPEFAKADFDKDNILEEAIASLPVAGEEQEELFSIMHPLTTFDTELTEQKNIALDDGERVIMKYEGDKNFTLIQEVEHSSPVASLDEPKRGELIDLGHSVGSLTENTIEWIQNGIQFYLASEDLTVDELIEVATSIDEVKEK